MRISRNSRPAVLLLILIVGTQARPAFGLSGPLSNSDGGGPILDASVFVGGCSGTLIRPDIVMTAGHCLEQHGYPGGPFEDLPIRRTGIWYPELGVRGDQIVFGNDITNPTYTTSATHYNIHDGVDLAFLALAEPVPESIAQPVDLLTHDPGVDWNRQFFRQAGWGPRETDGAAPTIRGSGGGRFGTFPDPIRPEVMVLRGGGNLEPGDSGGPLYWTDTDGKLWVIGAAQGGLRYTTTFVDMYDGNINPDEFNMQHYAASIAGKSAREQIDEQNARPTGRSLHEWYSPGRGDNYLTSLPGWVGDSGDTRLPDYRYSHSSGYVFSPDKPQPEGTTPLYSWWSPTREDNFSTAQETWVTSYDPEGENRGATRSPDYANARLDGFIYPPDQPQPPNTIPLYSWYSPGRNDNFTTTRWPGEPGDTRSPDYRFVALEGYVLASEPAASMVGDFDDDGAITVADLNALTIRVQSGSDDRSFDLNLDNVVDNLDRIHWVERIANTYLGDANLDGEFNSGDMVVVFAAGQYEDGIAGNSVWGTGDWDANGDFDSGDFVTAFRSGGYEKGPRSAVLAVPEPVNSEWIILCVVLPLFVKILNCQRRNLVEPRQ